VDEWISKHAAETVIAVVMAILAFFGKREIRRIDEKAGSEDVKLVADQLKSHIAACDIRAGRAEEKLDTVQQAITDAQVNIAKIAGKLGI